MTVAAPWLSVVMPTYDGERYVADALESVRSQAAEGIELVVVDDGSTDSTLEIVRRYGRTLPLRIVPHARTGNWVEATNVGLRAAFGRYACFLHQDDLWLPGRIDAVRRALAKDSPTLVVHHAVFVGPDGRRLGRWRCPLREPATSAEEFCERLLVQNFLAIPSPVFDRAAALRSGGLDESLWYTADWDLWLRLGRLGPVRLVDAALAAFRLHPESQTFARPAAEDELRDQMATVLARHLATCPVAAGRRGRVQRAAEFSVRVNSALAAVVRSDRDLPVSSLARAFLALGPRGWRRYLRDSRIVERALSRLRLRARVRP